MVGRNVLTTAHAQHLGDSELKARATALVHDRVTGSTCDARTLSAGRVPREWVRWLPQHPAPWEEALVFGPDLRVQ